MSIAMSFALSSLHAFYLIQHIDENFAKFFTSLIRINKVFLMSDV